MQKLWKHKRNIIIPFDHGSYSGPAPGIEDTLRITERIAKTKADGILITPGTLKKVAPVVGDLGIMLRIDGGFTMYAEQPMDYQACSSVDQALRLGADAVIVFTFVGTPAEAESLRRLGAAAAEADAWGMPLAAEILPPGLLNNHFGTNIFGKKRKKSDVFKETTVVARIGAEAGADIIKTRFAGNIEKFREVVDTCGAKVIVAGGPMLAGSDQNLLQLAYDCVQANAAGIIFGRNVWQHPRMEKLIAALAVIVHEEESVRNALALLR